MQQSSILILFLIFLGFTSNAQEYSYKRYTVDDGLPSNAVYGGMQDSRGYIWFYTEKGIARFDGYEFKTYTVKDGLPTNDIFYITEDQYGKLWFHSFARELVIMDVERDSFITISRVDTPTYNPYSILSNGKEVWALQNRGVELFFTSAHTIDTLMKDYPKTAQLLQSGYPTNYSYHFAPGHYLGFKEQDQQAFIGTSHGHLIDTFFFHNLNKKETKNLSNRTFNSYRFFQDKLYIKPINDSLIYCLDLESKHVNKINMKEHLGGLPDFVRFYLQDDILQIQTNLGLLIVNEKANIIDIFKPKISSDIQLERIFKDRAGNIWITSKEKGVYLLSAQERNTLQLSLAVKGDNAINCMDYFNQTIYLGSRQGNIYELSPPYSTTTLLCSGSSQYNDIPIIKSIDASKDNLWFIRQSDGIFHMDLSTQKVQSLEGQIKNLFKFDAKSLKRKSPPTEGTGTIKYLFSVGKDLFWNKHKNELIVGRGFFPYRCILSSDTATIQFLAHKRTYSVAYDSSETIWLGHNDGLGSFKNDIYTFHDDIKLLNGKNIWDLEVGSDNTLWAGTDGYGLVAYNGKNAFCIAGTEDDIIQDVFISEDEYIWIATNYGVKQIEQRKPLDQSAVVNIYNVNSGLVTREANSVIADSQYIFVGTSEGITQIRRQMVHYDSTAPTLYLDQILINGEKIKKNNIYHLTHNQNELEFFFTALSYKSFGNIQYEYQLMGADRSTIVTTNRSIRYSNLAPGTYTFNLIATDIQGIKSAALNPIEIIISPPWWQTKLFYVTLVLAITATIIGIYLWRVRNIQQKAEWETQINKQFAALELQALQAQMNPHFVFNALGAIQYFIQTNKKELADNYLAQFGHLMRLFLESSKNKYIKLAEEIKLLNTYIRLEKIRFKQKFDYQLTVAEDISTHNTFLPSMLLQPFVENAINHGLFHKDGGGLLSINIKKEDNGALKCIIEDNGIGREKAGEIKKRSKRNYKSRATQITEERLSALRKFEDFDIQFNIEDLFDHSGNPKGTKVIINIPEID